jgi:Na+/phosphate symporter
LKPSPEDKEELETLYVRTLERMEKATVLLMSRDSQIAEQFIREKEQINIQVRLSRKTRLEKPLSAQTNSANILDMIGCLRRINGQLTSVCYAIVRGRNQSGTPSGPIAPTEEEEDGATSIARTGAGSM